jgi:glycosyltransferase involved in cell wall biosynthesis
MYNILIKLKKKYKDIKLYPTMHTDYIFYANQIYSLYNFSSTLNYLDHYLDNKQFSGIIVTGDKMVEKYSKFTNSIFNANEINLEIFNNHKIDKYHKSTNTTYNFIYTGRISKEKNILEIFECCMILLKCDKKYNFILNIIGEGPYLNNIKSLLELEYKELNDIVIFHGNKNHNQLFDLYHKLDNRIFIFTSISETFGKTPMEAGATGIPIFIKKSENTDNLYIHKDNAIIFNDKNDFLQLFQYFINLNDFEKRILISNSINNIKKYDQKIIFEEWLEFILNGKILKDKAKLNIFNIFTFHGLSKFINCSGTILGD